MGGGRWPSGRRCRPRWRARKPSLRAARALLDEAIGEAWERAVGDGSVDARCRAGLRLAATHATAAGVQATEAAYRLAGGSAIYDSSPLQRRLRDAHVAAQHMLVAPATWELSGRVLLGFADRRLAALAGTLALVHLGLAIFATDESVSPGWLASRAEALGFESVFFPEHTHIPASRVTPYPAGGELPREYSRLLDPFVAATHAAAATETIRIGTGICLVAQHEPIACAKAVASVDHLSAGRLLFGVGAGWNEEEMRNHGVEPRTRFELVREHVEAMQAIWRDDEASYAGRHVRFERIWSWPKPVQRPIRRSSSAAMAGGCSTACWPTAITGCPTSSAATTRSSRASKSCASAPLTPDGESASPSTPPRRARTGWSATRWPVSNVASSTSRPPDADEVEAKIARVLESAATVGLVP